MENLGYLKAKVESHDRRIEVIEGNLNGEDGLIAKVSVMRDYQRRIERLQWITIGTIITGAMLMALAIFKSRLGL